MTPPTIGALLFLSACTEYRVITPPPPPPVDPPVDILDAQGKPPNFNDCSSGHYGLYFNLPESHPMVETDTDEPPPDLATADFYGDDYLAFARYDPSIDWGQGWWPVDAGLASDPQYFAVQWTSWLRVWDGGYISFLVGAEDDVLIMIDDQVLLAQTGGFEPDVFGMDLQGGQYPVKIRYAHRIGSNDGFRFRHVGGNAKICWPDFD